ncbi:Nitrogen permease regulator 2, partial [Ascosphaera aggregata]
GRTVKQWYLQHTRELANIDVRRFITYGVIKGFLYRVRKYAIATNEPAPHYVQGAATSASCHRQPQQQQNALYRGCGTSTANHIDVQASTKLKRMLGEEPTADDPSGRLEANDDGAAVTEEEEEWVDDHTLAKYLDGQHHFDQICTELELTDSELTARLQKFPNQVHIIHR